MRSVANSTISMLTSSDSNRPSWILSRIVLSNVPYWVSASAAKAAVIVDTGVNSVSSNTTQHFSVICFQDFYSFFFFLSDFITSFIVISTISCLLVSLLIISTNTIPFFNPTTCPVTPLTSTYLPALFMS